MLRRCTSLLSAAPFLTNRAFLLAHSAEILQSHALGADGQPVHPLSSPLLLRMLQLLSLTQPASVLKHHMQLLLLSLMLSLLFLLRLRSMQPALLLLRRYGAALRCTA